MSDNSSVKTILLFISLIVLVVGLSFISNRIWGGKPEQAATPKKLIIQAEMTIVDFGSANELPNPVLKEIFDLQVKSDLQKKLKEYGTPSQVASLVTKKLALAEEHGSKNWIKILIKFLLWFVFLSAAFIFFRTRKVTLIMRKWFLCASVATFGIVLGSDPSPMGTVKDAIHLYASTHAIFPPRMIALAVFLTIVILANKYICAWGCQLGTMQDLIFRINQNHKGKAVLGRQIKLPFVLTNSIRFMFLCVFTVVAFSWGIDIIEPIDPFKIYKPSYLGLAGGIFAGCLLVASLFFYRPWCHFFCPFGFVGWLFETKSLVKINVDYETCIACQKCASACPSQVMSAILKQNTKTIPDCFGCYTCMEVCPTDSIRFSTRKRTLPPAGHFDRKI